MTGKKMIVILAAVAGMHPTSSRDLAAGHWTGQIDRDGWLQPLSLDIENDDGAYRGEWRAADGIASEPLQKVDVSGDTVRLETDKLLFVGRVQGSKLSGTVSHSNLELLGDNHGVRFPRCEACARVFVVQDGRIWSFPTLRPAEPTDEIPR